MTHEPRNKHEAMNRIANAIAVCESKTAFRTRHAALICIGNKGWKQEAYRCPICDEWHLTTKKGQTT